MPREVAGADPGLVDADLTALRAATLLIAGGDDSVALRLNRSAANRLGGENRLAVVAGAGPGLREAGARERVAQVAVEWFARHL